MRTLHFWGHVRLNFVAALAFALLSTACGLACLRTSAPGILRFVALLIVIGAGVRALMGLYWTFDYWRSRNYEVAHGMLSIHREKILKQFCIAGDYFDIAPFYPTIRRIE